MKKVTNPVAKVANLVATVANPVVKGVNLIAKVTNPVSLKKARKKLKWLALIQRKYKCKQRKSNGNI